MTCYKPCRPDPACHRTDPYQQGSILPVLLVMLAIISLLIAGVVNLTAQQMTVVKSKQQELNALTEVHNTLEILRYALLTRPYTAGGMVTDLSVKRPDSPFQLLKPYTDPELRFDNTLYQGWGRSTFAIQDADTLINLNQTTAGQLNPLLTLAGIPAEERRRLTDSLQDYIDEDDTARSNGGERSAYAAENLPAPANRPLVSTAEIQHIRYWRDSDLFETPLFQDAITVVGNNIFNANTSPPQVVQAGTGYTGERLTQFIEARPYHYVEEIYEVMGNNFPISFDSIVYLASKHFRIRLYHPDLNYYEELFISFSLKEEDGHPWIIESALRLPATGAPDPETAQDTGLRFFDPAYLERDTAF